MWIPVTGWDDGLGLATHIERFMIIFNLSES